MATTTTALPARVLAPDEGKRLNVFGSGLVFKIVGNDSGGQLFLVESVEPVGSAGPPFHVHERTDELYYILDGSVSFRLNDQIVPTDPGAVVYIPRGVPHTFTNTGDTPARLLAMMNPAGREDFFEALAAVGDRPDRAKIAALGQAYDVIPVSPAPGKGQ